MNGNDYAQAVMKAAGVEPEGWEVQTANGGNEVHTSKDEALYAYMKRLSFIEKMRDVSPVYPCPLTSAEGFLALWDALEAKGWRVEFRTLLDGTLAQVYKADEMGRPDLASIFQGGHEDRKAALVEAAGRALGVTR